MTRTKIAGYAVLTLVASAAFIAALGATYNALSLRHYRALAGVPGKLVSVDGYKMHLFCSGQGVPAIILDAGLGDDSLIWAKVQPQLSRSTTVCSYDRAGFGWSEARPGDRDANTIATQLHDLLHAAGLKPPFVLMGHSISGVRLRAYASRYPTDLAGLIFVDGATPLQNDRIPTALVDIQNRQRRNMPWTWWKMALGWYRINGQCTEVTPGFERYAAWIKADSCDPGQVTAIERELDFERLSGEQTVHAGPFPELPILIISRDPSVYPPNWPVAVGKANALVWNTMQEEAKALSPHSRRIIARHSDHNIQLDRPDLINKVVPQFIDDIRNKNLSRLDKSTTYQ